jgi:dihydroorotase
LPRNTGTITLQKRAWTVPEHFKYAGGDALVPLRAGESLDWKLVD